MIKSQPVLLVNGNVPSRIFEPTEWRTNGISGNARTEKRFDVFRFDFFTNQNSQPKNPLEILNRFIFFGWFRFLRFSAVR